MKEYLVKFHYTTRTDCTFKIFAETPQGAEKVSHILYPRVYAIEHCGPMTIDAVEEKP